VSATDDLLANNGRYAKSFSGEAAGRPARGVAVVACMDARMDVYALLGLAPGEAHVIRNAGGEVTEDVLRSLTISQHELGTTEVLLIHHSECGMRTFTGREPVRSRTWMPTSGSPSRACGNPRSCGTRSPCAASSTTWRPACSARCAELGTAGAT